jgi:hypothetical protein
MHIISENYTMSDSETPNHVFTLDKRYSSMHQQSSISQKFQTIQ